MNCFSRPESLLKSRVVLFAASVAAFSVSHASAQIWPNPNRAGGSLLMVSNLFVPSVGPCSFANAPFTSDRFGALLPDRMQLVAHYDGSGVNAYLTMEMRNPQTGHCCTLRVRMLPQSQILAQEFVLGGYEPTGEFTVSGAVPNGAVDGIAFGLYVRDVSGNRWMLKSHANGLASADPNFAGGWPMAWGEATWDSMLPAGLGGTGVTGFFARRQAQATLAGAQLLPNGTYIVPTGVNPIFGDLDGSGCVDMDDMNLFNWHASAPPMGYIGLCPTPIVTYTPDRFSALPLDRLQIVAVYDGNGSSAMLDLEMWNPFSLTQCTLSVPLPASGTVIALEYQMNGYEPTGEVMVSGVLPNGAIDGVAFGLYFRDINGDRCLMRSDTVTTGPDFAGAWPVGWSEAQWDTMLPPLLGNPPGGFDAFVARRQAQSTLSGARFLPDGLYRFATCNRMPDQTIVDFNGDGIADLLDMHVLIGQLGTGCCP